MEGQEEYDRLHKETESKCNERQEILIDNLFGYKESHIKNTIMGENGETQNIIVEIVYGMYRGQHMETDP